MLKIKSDPENILEHLDKSSFISHKSKLIYLANHRTGKKFWRRALRSFEDIDLNKGKLSTINSLQEIIELQKKDYKVFTTIRHPEIRLFSAWVQRVIKGENEDMPIRDFPYPTSDIPSSFKLFVNYIEEKEKEYSNFNDRHWNSQAKWLLPDKIKYDIIIETPLNSLMYSKWSEEVFLEKRDMSPYHVSALKYSPDYSSKEISNKIKEIYKLDFEKFSFTEGII